MIDDTAAGQQDVEGATGIREAHGLVADEIYTVREGA